jgi:hypothetical protein
MNEKLTAVEEKIIVKKLIHHIPGDSQPKKCLN